MDRLASLSPELQGKYALVADRLSGLGSAVLAYSGGVDSTLVLAIGHEVLGDRLLAVVATSATYPPEELDGASRCAAEIGARLEIVRTEESSHERFAANPPDRCFYCKQELMAKLAAIRDREGLATIVDGTNADDEADHRPGRIAAEDAGVVSPLLEAGLTKREVRELSRALGLITWDKPAMPCLASRIPYGTAITPEAVAMVHEAEQVIIALGFADVRVRHHGDVARVEVPPEAIPRAVEVKDAIVEACERAGFTYVALDLVGYRTGSMNESIGRGRGGSPPTGRPA